jgi:hypothetical protein
MQAGVYRFAAAAALAVPVSLVAATYISQGPSGEGHAASPSYFATVAQVLPVLLLAFAVEKSYFKSDTDSTRGSLTFVAFAVVAMAVTVGEVLALVVVAHAEPSHELMVDATTWSGAGVSAALALIVGQLVIESRVLWAVAGGEFWKDLTTEKETGKWLAIVAIIAVAAAEAYGEYARHDKALWIAAIGVVGVVALFFFLLWLLRPGIGGEE